ncbi:MAG: hypothetical protein JST22_11875 [Bacteroidetes bacterium]|nr:hypothetical protein [Bacteroidota bacterium]
MMLIHTDQERWNQLDPRQQEQHTQHHRNLAQELIQQGTWVDGGRLHSPASGASVRLDNGRVIRVDGPYAETKELVGGYYIVECADLDEACALAARIPTAAFGTIEVRPLM